MVLNDITIFISLAGGYILYIIKVLTRLVAMEKEDSVKFQINLHGKNLRTFLTILTGLIYSPLHVYEYMVEVS